MSLEQCFPSHPVDDFRNKFMYTTGNRGCRVYEHDGQRVWLEVDLSRLKDNYKKIRDYVQPAGVIGVLKANAYGIGVSPAAKALTEAGVSGFGVAELREAAELVRFGLPVQILGGILDDEIPEAVTKGIILPITDRASAEEISREAVKQNTTAPVEILIDTGMGRLGMLPEEAEEAVPDMAALPGINIGGIYSHFPIAYRGEEEAFNALQIERFTGLLKKLEGRGITFRKIHIANSDGVNNIPASCSPPFTHVRVGLNLHGSFESEGRRSIALSSIFTLKTRLVSIRTLPAGTSIGYGRTYTLRQPAKVGIIAAGYADGLPLALSNRGYVLIHGRPCPVLGRVSMDYTTISLEHAPEAVRGDEVVCLGKDKGNEITVEEWARLKGTHAYDIICSFGSRVSRRYV